MVRTLIDLGGLAINGMPVVGLLKEGGKVSGVEVRDSETGEAFRVLARAVINASGVEADAVRVLDDPRSAPSISPSRGTHVVLDRAFLPGSTAVMIPRTDDGRVLFAIPWRGRVLLGTTDTPVDRPDPEPRPSTEEIAYLLDHAGRYFATKPRLEDVRSTFAGLRPLLGKGTGGRTSGLSREHAVIVADSGLITIAGGKWTTYRRMGRDAVDRAVEVAGLTRSESKTEDLRIHGWTSVPVEGQFAAYGSDAPEIQRLIDRDPELARPIHPDWPDPRALVVWAAREELARSVEDVLARRTRLLFLDARASVEAAPEVASILAGELRFGPDWERGQVAAFRELASGYQAG